MKVIQCTLESHKSTQVAYLDIRPDLSIGKYVTLKDSDNPDRRWRVMGMGHIMEKSEIKRSHQWYENDFVRDGKSFRNVR